MTVSDSIEQIIKAIQKDASLNSAWHPVDRATINAYLPMLLHRPSEVIYYNFEFTNQLWANNFLLCLPELWMNIQVDDIIDFIEGFSRSTSYYSLFEFTYKFIQIDISPLVFGSDYVLKKFGLKIIEYLERQGDLLFLTPDDLESLESEEGEHLGYKQSDWIYIKQHLLLDERIRAARADSRKLKEDILTIKSQSIDKMC